MPAIEATTQDFVLAGGGLQNGLIALMLLHRDPSARVTLVEEGPTLGGNHTWSYHASDVPEPCRAALAPLSPFAWDRYRVCFPSFEREVRSGYRSFLSRPFHGLLARRFAESPNARLILNAPVSAVESDRITLSNGDVHTGRTIIDGRGLNAGAPVHGAGYQKFVGLELQLERPGPFRIPVLMDARVPQTDGFRFFYVLPFAPDRVLVEETRFSDNARLDIAELRGAVLAYAAEHGMAVREVLRVESGVLPMPYTRRRQFSKTMPLVAGYAGGFQHPATGYSFPVALRVARFIADRAPESPPGAGWDAFVREHRHQYNVACFLNRLLFTAYPPGLRHHIFRRFYQLPEPVIERFYRLELTHMDLARLFVGRPPRGLSVRRLLEGAPEA